MAALPDRLGGPDPGDRVADRDELRRALATLSPRQRAVLVLRHYEGWDDAAIAAALRCSEATVRTHASRGRQRLGAALGLVSPPAGVPPAGVPPAGVRPAGPPPAGVPAVGLPAADGPDADPTTVPEGP